MASGRFVKPAEEGPKPKGKPQHGYFRTPA
jgi:hypothetical protein